MRHTCPDCGEKYSCYFGLPEHYATECCGPPSDIILNGACAAEEMEVKDETDTDEG